MITNAAPTMLLAIELFFSLISVLLAIEALRGSGKAWKLESHPIDLAMRMLSFLWIVYVLISVIQTLAARQLIVWPTPPAYVGNIVFEFLLASAAFFLLNASGTVRPWIFYVLALQLVGGLLAELWSNWSAQSSPIAQWTWLALNLASAVLVSASVMRQTRHTNSRRSWLTLAACAMGFGLWLYQAVAQGGTHAVLPVVWHLYAFILFVVWKLVSLNADAEKALVNAGTSFGTLSSYQPLASVRTDDEFISLALRGERQRISFELHDNIGSQIVSVLFAMQAAEQPQKRFVMLSLEQCLSDLKMMVDALDSFEENVTTALGRLRYRIQHALDRQSIQMRWDVEICDELDAVRGIYAQQVLRIAQESLANVMRHASARSVRVVCRYVPEFCQLLLEVRDDGVGISPEKSASAAGRGFESMKRRAAAVGGFLVVSSRQAEGTCIRLTLPLPHVATARGGMQPMPAVSSANAPLFAAQPPAAPPFAASPEIRASA